MSDDWFWGRVDRGPDDECWLWTGYVRRDGYGQVTHANRRSGAHRWAYELHHGDIPRGLLVCHSCDTPLCCNPGHLFVGSVADNQRDASLKGRLVNPMRNPASRAKAAQPGERNPMAKLDAERVSEIRARSRQGDRQRDIAHSFGVSQATISMIVNGHTW